MKQFVLPVALVAILAGATTASVRAVDNDVQETIPSALATVNPCNGDAVALTGEMHFLVHSTTSESGNVSGNFSFNSRYDGIGVPSNKSYQGSEDYMDSYEIGNGSAFVETVSQDLHLTSQTGEDNYTVRVHTKVTINSNGVPTAEITDFNSYCGG